MMYSLVKKNFIKSSAVAGHRVHTSLTNVYRLIRVAYLLKCSVNRCRFLSEE